MTPPQTGLCEELQSLCAELRGQGEIHELRLMALLARLLPQTAAAKGLLDAKLGVYSEEFFLRLTASELAEGRQAGLVVLRSDRVPEIREKKGDAVAEQVMLGLAEFIRPRQGAAEWLGRLGADSLALLLPEAGLLTAQERAQTLHDAVRQNIRFPVSTGVAHTQDLLGGHAELVRLAREAAGEACTAGSRYIHTRTSRGPVAPPVSTSPPPAKASDSSLAARYQKLVLLNRMSLELFADKPFAEALAGAANTILALTGAKHVAVYFCDDFGQPILVHRHGEGPFIQDEARREEEALLARALTERRMLSWDGPARGWLAAPLLHARQAGTALDGALLVGYDEPGGYEPGWEQAMLEISRQMRNARLQQKHLEHQHVLAAVTEQSADAIYITDLASRIISWNAGAAALFQCRADEAVGQTFHFLVPKERLHELESLNEQALREGCVKNLETVCQRKDGSLVPVEATFFLLCDEKERPFGMVRVFRDITKRKEVDRMKTEFVSLVSHELRTPLTSIQGFAETIFDFWDELMPDQRRHYLTIILNEARRLGRLVTNFLDISKLEAGSMPLKPSLIDLPAIGGRAAALFKEHPAKPVFALDFAPGSERAWADEDQIYRILVNLLGNAVKYTPPGGTIAISGRAASGDVEVVVADQGPGISAQDQAKIFQKFYRSADTVSRSTPGTGLGLAICKSIVEGHGGKIRVESGPGPGTRFIFSFPREALKP